MTTPLESHSHLFKFSYTDLHTVNESAVAVFFSTHYYQIFEAVICSNSIKVVDNFSGFKASTQMSCHYKAMSQNHAVIFIGHRMEFVFGIKSASDIAIFHTDTALPQRMGRTSNHFGGLPTLPANTRFPPITERTTTSWALWLIFQPIFKTSFFINNGSAFRAKHSSPYLIEIFPPTPYASIMMSAFHPYIIQHRRDLCN